MFSFALVSLIKYYVYLGNNAAYLDNGRFLPISNGRTHVAESFTVDRNTINESFEC